MTLHTLNRPGGTLAYRDLPGKRRPIVLVHGAGVTHEIWNPQLTALHNAGHRVVAVDLRGHGASHLTTTFTIDDTLDDLIALLEHLNLDEPVLVGHSLGGNLLQMLINEWPELASRLVVIDSTWNTGPLTGSEEFWLDMAAPLLRLIPARSLPRMMARASAITPSAIATLETLFTRMPKARFLDIWRATASVPSPDDSYRTPIPLTLAVGDRDTTGNIATAMRAWADAENITLHVIPDAGHVPSLDNPDAVTALLINVAE